MEEWKKFLDPKNWHEAAKVFPLIEGSEFATLVDDIKKNGLLEPPVVFENKLLDGRNRLRACVEAGVTPEIETWRPKPNESPIDFIVAKNLVRRHLDTSQRSAVATDLLPLYEQAAKERESRFARMHKFERKAKLPDAQIRAFEKGQSRDKVAEALNVSGRSISDAKFVKEKEPETFEKIRRGEISVSKAAKGIRRKEKHEAMAGKNPERPEGKFNVIYADPPWQYDFEESDSRKVENQYPTMGANDISALELLLSPLFEKDCILFLWATAPKLQEALNVMKEWGFEYKTHAIWDKEKIGMGYYFRGRHELLLVGTRGAPPSPGPESRPPSIFVERRREHSRKPEIAYRIIEKMYPHGKYLELFSRNQRSGWTMWGNDSTLKTE